MAASTIGRRPPPTPIERILRPFQEFMHTEISGGIVLLLAAVVALVWANSPVWESYHDVWGTYLSIGVGDWSFRLSVHHFINDALMAVFFFVVGLEIKREMLVGELASARAAALPIAGAVGGAVVPALIYVAINPTGVEASGWGIPMATDIAFALGVLALTHPVTVGIIVGLVVGKPVGIMLCSWLSVRSGVAVLPQGVTWQALLGVSFLAGIGFTMSLVVATLAFGEGSPLLDSAKIGILGASAIAALLGWILLARSSAPAAAPRRQEEAAAV